MAHLDQLLTALGLARGQMSALCATSAAARWGWRSLRLAESLQRYAPLLAGAVTICLTAPAVFAQGPIFTPDNGQFGNAIVGFIRLLYQGLFVLGFVGIAWFIFNYLRGQEFSKQLIGAILCWGAGLVAMAVYNASRGQVVQIDTTTLGGN